MWAGCSPQDREPSRVTAAGVSLQSRPPDGLVEMRHSQICSDEARLRPSQECDHRSGTGLVTVTEVKWCPVINRQDCRVETELRSSWEVVHESGSGSMCSMARHRHGCDRAVNRHTIKPAQTGSKGPELTWNGTPVPMGMGGSPSWSYSGSFMPFGALGALRNFDQVLESM